MKSEVIMGITIDNLTYQDILNDIPKYKGAKKMIVTSVNPQIIVESKKYPEIVKFINQSTHRIPDGIGIVLVSKLFGGEIRDRVTGFDLMVKFLDYANEHRKSVFFYGAQPDVLSDMIEKVHRSYPDMIITGGIDGYTSLAEDEIIDQINQLAPDFLFVALGFPKQEQWLQRNTHRLNVKVFQDVGGSFDVLSGHVQRAPQFFIDYHLEWLYRSLSNPKRIGRIFQLPVFVWKSVWWKYVKREQK